MNGQKKITILVCVFLTTLNIVACGQVKEEEIINVDKSATSQQENNAQTVESTDLEIIEDETVKVGESSVNQQEINMQVVENTDSKTKEDETVNNEEFAVNRQENSKQTVESINSETTDDISGSYIYPVDDSKLVITADVDGSYSAELILIRLTCIDDFTGNYKNSILTITGTDAAGNFITAEITFSNEQAILTFTDSTWEYLGNGKQYIFNKE